MRRKLSLEALTVETFEPGEALDLTPASPDTFATTGGGYFCAADCGTGVGYTCRNC